jgi:diaminohydroxyphosphoribosylaminopyrimidine deaminase/5-amino-6-(5-phosphoribosylamino)uracil reductase
MRSELILDRTTDTNLSQAAAGPSLESTRPHDARFMDLALALGRRGLGRTWPNPAVGAVVVHDGADGPLIVGRGWTQPGGRPHAETEALGRAGAAARYATLYVTLEPCSHHGKTPPCADAIIAAGIARVVSALGIPIQR